MRFRLLGDVEAGVGDHRVDLGHARQRLVLGALLVDVDQPVPVDRLADRVWGGHPPHGPRNALSSYLSRLRRSLAALDGVRIRRDATGYVLAVDPLEVDLHLFRHLVARARAERDDERAAELFDRALGLWRSDAFADLDTPWINTVRADLAGERFAAELEYTDLRLRHGRHTEVVTGLAARTREHPLDERLAGQFMLALYRSGRQADALAHYRRVRSRLVEDLGVDPGPELQELHRQILAGPPAPAAGDTVPVPTPRQLPAAPALFTGRQRELDLSADPPGVLAISGTGGVGKTWLALHWAHRHVERFPDGQLYVDLRGFTPTGPPLAPAVALRDFLEAFGMAPNLIPSGLDALVGRYRSVLADKRVLVVLDNAADTAQVVPLMPGSPTCTVLVTSRTTLTGLVTAHGARSLELDVLDEADARQLLAGHVGAARLAAEPESANSLLERCAGLPLAIGIVGARAARHPGFPLAVLADQLADQTSRLDALDLGEPGLDLRAVFSWSCRALSPAACSLFALLSVAPGPDIGLPAAAALGSLSASEARALLQVLETAHLVEQHTPGRYRMHDLVRLYAAEQAHHDVPAAELDAVLHKLVDFYCARALTADALLEPGTHTPELPQPAADGLPGLPATAADALAWFHTESRCLLAAQQLATDRQWHRTVYPLTVALDTFRRRGHFADSLQTWRNGLDAARHLADPVARIRGHRWVGDALGRAGDHAEADVYLKRSMALAEEAGDITQEAHTGHSLTWSAMQQGDLRAAIDHATRSHHIYRDLDYPLGQGEMLDLIGWCHALLGDYDDAHRCCAEALDLHRAAHHQQSSAVVLRHLGYIAAHTDRHREAETYYRQSLDLHRALGDSYREADVLADLGDTHRALGRHHHADYFRRLALVLYRAQHRTAEADRIERQLDR